MTGEWQPTTLGDLIDVKHGFAFQGEFIHDEPRGDILLTPGNFAIGGGFKEDKFKYYDGPVPDEFVLAEGDLLVTMTDLSKQADTLGYSAFVPRRPDDRRYLHNQRLGKVQLREPGKIDIRYLHYLLSTAGYRNEILASATGTTVKHTSPGRIRRFRFLRPSIGEQRAIAHILSALDDKIELNRRMNATLEGIAQAIFKSWFVDFEPVRAKAIGEPPESICRRLGLTPNLLINFPDRLVDSELGKIPEGWVVSTVRAMADSIFSGGTPDTRIAEYWNGNFNWFSSGETRNRFVIGTERTITQGGVDNSSTRLAVPGDILIASAGQGGTRGQTSYCAIRTYVNQSVICVRVKSDAMHPLWLFHDLSRRYEEMRSISDSHSSRGSLTTKLIGGMSVVYPGGKLVDEFAKLTGPTAIKQVANQRESETLAACRHSLLPKLLSGELRVQVEGAA